MAKPDEMNVAGYRFNHYVPVWYQKRFIDPASAEQKYWYLDLHPDSFLAGSGRKIQRNALLHWGPKLCFGEENLYTTTFGGWESTEIEEKFFGSIDSNGRDAIAYFSAYKHPGGNGDALQNLLEFMCVQKLRTPKGLNWLGSMTELANKNDVLFAMQRLRYLHGAIWTESIWQLADAADSRTKFIVSDHPVTVYNKGCFPGSRWCSGSLDPAVWRTGTHTIFPLSLDRILILTNLSWLRDPNASPHRERPHPIPIRPAVFSFHDIQVERHLTEVEVQEINYITKMRARRYVAAGQKEWLFPEESLATTHWSKLGGGDLLMADPRSVVFAGNVAIEYRGGHADVFDEYGRPPEHPDHENEGERQRERATFLRHQGEFAKRHGRKRRGRAFFGDRLDPEEDTDDYHRYHLNLAATKRPTR